MALRVRLLGHPAFAGAVALLAINDHLLKARFPGWWTGKLSDIAGVFILAVLLGLLTRRPRLATVITAAAFAALKLSPAMSSLVAPVLGGATRQDSTDLLALVSLGPAYWFVVTVGKVPPEPSAARSVLAFLSSTATLLSVTATSCSVPPVVDGFATNGANSLFARIREESSDLAGNSQLTARWAQSNDGGHSWRPVPAPLDAKITSGREACDGSKCFRIVNGDRVEERSPAGHWNTSFGFTAEQRRRLALRANATCDRGPDVDLRAVTTLRLEKEMHVVVAAGTQGVLHRLPSGRWERRAVLDRKPLSLRGPSWVSWLSLAPFAVLFLSPVVFLIGWRRGSWRQGLLALLIVVVVGIGLLALGGGLVFFAVDTR